MATWNPKEQYLGFLKNGISYRRQADLRAQ